MGFNLVVDGQRLKYAMEYVDKLTAPVGRYGVLFSGPNGVGKHANITRTTVNMSSIPN